MAGENEELQILIKTLADTYGVKEVNNALSNLQSTVQESGHEIEKHNEHHREMHVLFRELNKVLPESGHLLHGVFGGPQVLLIMATVVAVSKLVEMIKEHNKQLEEARKLQADIKVEVWKDQIDAVTKTREAIEEANKKIIETISSVDHLKEAQEALKAVTDEQLKQQEKLTDGDKLRAAELKRQSEERKQQLLEETADMDEERLHRRERDLEVVKGMVVKGAPGGEEAAEAKTKLADLEPKLKQAEEDLAKAKGPHMAESAAMAAAGFSREYITKSFQEKVKKAEDHLTELNNAYISNTKAVEAHTRKEKELTDLLNTAIQERDKAFQAAHAARQSALTGGSVLKAQTEGEMNAQLFNAGFQPSPIGRSVLTGIRAAEGMTHGDIPTQGQDYIVAGLIRALEAQGATSEKINQLLLEMADMHKTQEQKIKDIYDALRITRLQTRTTVNP